MGEILDSYYVSDYSVTQYTDRTTEYLDELENMVDIWEIGNEINGDWLGTTSDVVQKMEGAYNLVKARNKPTALTLYYNKSCFYDHPENEMFTWVNANISNTLKQGLDYVLVSYYEDDCENVILTEAEWQDVFDSLHVIFPNAKLGMGECGTTDPNKKAAYMDRYYHMNITTPNYIGGYFWWYYLNDCVPKSKALWTTINDISCEYMPLAVTYLSPFHGLIRHDKIELFWETGTEINADAFIIERLSSNNHWEKIASVQAGQSNYHVTDTHPNNGMNFYRLQQIDFDGKSNYSEVISLYFNTEWIRIYPNPASTWIHIQDAHQRVRHIQIKNMLNQIILNERSSSKELNISNLPKGLYTLTIDNFFHQKLVIE